MLAKGDYTTSASNLCHSLFAKAYANIESLNKKLNVVLTSKKVENGVSMSLIIPPKPTVPLQKVADYFLCLATENKKPISNKKLQKLVYYAQAWNLVFTGNMLFKDPIEAWLHGPAVRNLWHTYKDYGYQPIQVSPTKPKLDDDKNLLLDEIWRVYGKHDADYLEALTHSEKPWQQAREGLEANQLSSIEIDTDVMKVYYSELNGKKVS